MELAGRGLKPGHRVIRQTFWLPWCLLEQGLDCRSHCLRRLWTGSRLPWGLWFISLHLHSSKPYQKRRALNSARHLCTQELLLALTLTHGMTATVGTLQKALMLSIPKLWVGLGSR